MLLDCCPASWQGSNSSSRSGFSNNGARQTKPRQQKQQRQGETNVDNVAPTAVTPMSARSSRALWPAVPSDTPSLRGPDKESAIRLELQTKMALTNEESSAAQQSSAAGAADISGSTNAVEGKDRSNADINESAAVAAAGAALVPPPPGVGASAPPSTKRTARELLETRNTTSKMEIGEGVLLAADINGADLVIMKGRFEGNVNARCIDIEQGAEVKGAIECDAARIDGKFDGVLCSTHSLHLASHADVSGRVVYRRLKIAKGAQLHGKAEYRSPVVASVKK
ncbi:unnamed protein product [Pylaiella littoralis]